MTTRSILNTEFAMTLAGAAVLAPPAVRKVKFDAEFIERRMREHRELQEQMAAELEYDIIREVLLSSEARQ